MTAPQGEPQDPAGTRAAGGPAQAGSPAGATSTTAAHDGDRLGRDLTGLDLGAALEAVQEAEHEGRPPAAGTTANVLTALAVLALGVAALLGAGALGVGSAERPAAGTWPLLVAVVTVVIGAGMVVAARRTTDAERFTRASLLVLVGLATMVLFVVLLPVIGFEIPALLLCFAWLRLLGGEGWRLSVLVSLALVAAFYLVFVGALSVPIPHLF